MKKWNITGHTYPNELNVTISHDHNNNEDEPYCNYCDTGEDSITTTLPYSEHNPQTHGWKAALTREIRTIEGYKTIFRGAIQKIKEARGFEWI